MYPREYFDTFWRGDLRNEVFVIMSFAPEFNAVWNDAIRPAIEEDTADRPSAHRVDVTTLAGNIVNEILDGVAHARLVLAEISVSVSGRWAGQRNGNAMYELGLAHALRQPTEVVIARSDNEPLNFDIAQIKVQSYDRNDLASARQLFSALLNGALAEIDTVKGLKVDQAVAQLDVDCLNMIVKDGGNDYFSIEAARTMRDVMHQTATGVKSAVARLLSLGVLRCDADMRAGRYAYHWTLFGQAVLRKLGIR